ncbi:MAG: lipoate--protein ligase family protein [Planctomycetota bacterium]|jgi:lipoate-protein ligase A
MKIEELATSILVPGTGDRAALANLADDERLFRFVSEDAPSAWRLYVNPPCVVLGKHQHVEREVNLTVATRRGTPVLKRFTGGGAVYHDEGNLNFTVCERASPGGSCLPLYERYTSWLRELLEALGLETRGAGNRVDVAGRKVSGLAARVGKRAALVHGTVLVSSDLERLREHLDVPQNQFRDLPPPARPHVVSKPAPETTLSEALGRPLDMEGFTAQAREALENHFGFGEWNS